MKPANIPIPEPHVTALAVAALLGRLVPRPVRSQGPWPVAGGLVACAAGLAAWATWATGSVDLARPARLVTRGPYRWSRNPMYVAWTLGYVALALRSGSRWPWFLLPGVVAWTHATVLREERQLERTFGDAWFRFSAGTPRYVGPRG